MSGNWGELTLGTDPLNEDTDEDDLSDGDEVITHHTNPLSNDTDMDGLTDYEELRENITYNLDYYGVNRTHHTEQITIYAKTLSPLNPDTDSDGLTDGQEVNGWRVMLAWQEEGKEKMITEERVYNTNALIDQRNILDSDQDGLSDWVESSIAMMI